MTRQASAGTLDRDEVAYGGPGVTRGVAAERPVEVEARASLVLRAQAGDPVAFDALVRVRIDGAFRLAVAIVRSEADAADAVQDAFLAAWRNLPDLRDPGRFDAWLDRIVVNACRMTLRHRRGIRVREIEVAPYGEDRSSMGPPAADPAVDRSSRDIELVRAALERLDTDKRAILVLHHLEGRPVEEIATVLGIPVGTVKWRLHAARAALQRALEEALR